MKKELTSAITWAFLDNLTEGVIVAETNGTIRYINQAGQKLLGLQQNVPSLTEVYQVVAPHEVWQSLLNPPVETYLHTVDGRILHLQSKFCFGNNGNNPLVQILVNLHQNAISPTNTTPGFEQLTSLTRISSEPDFDKKLQLIVNGLQMTGWNRVILTLRDEGFNTIQRITAGFTPEEIEFLTQNAQRPDIWLRLFDDPEAQGFRYGACYFVPGTSSWLQQHFLNKVLPDDKATGSSADAWHSDDLLCIPLYDSKHRRIGLLGLDRPQNGRRPDQTTFQTIELYAQFAASIIENAQLINETISRNHDFELLLQASNEISKSLEQEMVLELMGKHMLRALQGDGYIIYRWKDGTNSLTTLKEYPIKNWHQNGYTPVTVPVEGHLFGRLSQLSQPLVLPSSERETTTLPKPAWLPEGEAYITAVLPITLSEELFGLIEVFRVGKLQTISPRELQLLTALSNQASSALETALTFEDTYERERFYNAMGTVSLAINSALEREAVLNLICSEGLRLFGVDGSHIWQLEGDQYVCSAAKGIGQETFVGSSISILDDGSFVASVARTGEATYINDIPHSTETRATLLRSEQTKSALGVPVEQEGMVIGVLILVDKTNPNRFSDKDVSQATAFGGQVAIALQNTKLFEELRLLNEQLDLRVADRTQALHEESNRVKILLRISSELAASLDEDRVLNQALHLVNEVIDAKQGVILLINQETGELIFRAAFGMEVPLQPKGSPSGLMRSEGLAGWMIENLSAVIVHDTHTDSRWVDRQTSRDHRSVLGVPLVANEEAIGVLMLFHTEPNVFTSQQLDLVEAAAIQVANAISNANLYELIREQARRLGTMLRDEQIETAKNQAILESIADGVLVADDHSKIILANLPVSNILEIPSEQLLGKSVNELVGLYGHSGDFWIRAIENWAQNADRIEKGSFLADQLTIEEKVVSVHLSPVLARNQFFGTVSIFRDITKEVEVDKLKSEFVSTVSHELRTPMTSIKGYADLMLMGAAGAMTEPQIRYLKVIKNNADRLHMLVNDLLNISRIETGKTTLDLRPLDIPQVIEQVVEGHLRGRIQHEKKKLNVYTEISSSLPLVNADHAKVTQILTNLLDNAFNYTPPDGEIRVSTQADDRYVYIGVSDSGIGISKDNLPKIFDRFFRAEDEAVQKVPGTGLGLAIVRSLIEMHGGKLEVTSTMGKGSTFMFNLPVVVEDSDPT